MENTHRHQVHNLIILDESGSMDSIKGKIIEGFNEIVQTVKGIEKQFPDQEHFISLITFNGLGQKILHFIDPVSKLNTIDYTQYKPDASTPLFDALGFSFAKMRQVVENVDNCNVLVTIMTDGEENASKEYTGKAIKQLIEELKLKNWTFTYIGTDHDVEKFADSLSINNKMAFKKDSAGIKAMFSKERNARMGYAAKMAGGSLRADDDFYGEDNPRVPQ